MCVIDYKLIKFNMQPSKSNLCQNAKSHNILPLIEEEVRDISRVTLGKSIHVLICNGLRTLCRKAHYRMGSSIN